MGKPMKAKVIIRAFQNFYTMQIIWTVSASSGQGSDYPDSFWIIRIVSGLSGQFLGNPESFKIVQNYLLLSGEFLEYSDSF